jgi:hypothetical protein
VRNTKAWLHLLGLVRTVLEGVVFDEDTDAMVVSVRPRKGARQRCGRCGIRPDRMAGACLDAQCRAAGDRLGEAAGTRASLDGRDGTGVGDLRHRLHTPDRPLGEAGCDSEQADLRAPPESLPSRLDRGALAGFLRPGNAGANDAGDHIEVLRRSLAQLPEAYQSGHRLDDDPELVVPPILVRTDSADATHDFVDELIERNLQFSMGFHVDERVREALCYVQEEDWERAIETDGSVRDGAQVAELTHLGTGARTSA